MPVHQNTLAGAPCWIEVTTSDVTAARAFYCALFGWTAEEPNKDLGGYFNFRKDGVRVAGGMTSQPGMPSVWSVYLNTPDAEKAVAAAEQHGGRVVAPAMPVADLGVMAVVTDPGGALVGIWQPGKHRGFGVAAEPGAPGWFELHTRDYDGALDFYRAVFGWATQTVSDTPEFRYTVMIDPDGPADDNHYAGVMDASVIPDALPEGAQAQWGVYFAVGDADATVAKAVELGGSLVRAAEDTPYGRLAALADPTGAVFKVVGPNVGLDRGTPAGPAAS